MKQRGVCHKCGRFGHYEQMSYETKINELEIDNKIKKQLINFYFQMTLTQKQKKNFKQMKLMHLIKKQNPQKNLKKNNLRRIVSASM